MRDIEGTKDDEAAVRFSLGGGLRDFVLRLDLSGVSRPHPRRGNRWGSALRRHSRQPGLAGLFLRLRPTDAYPSGPDAGARKPDALGARTGCGLWRRRGAWARDTGQTEIRKLLEFA